MGLSPEQRAIFDAEIAALRDRAEERKALMALPTRRQRATDLDRLRVAVDRLKAASAPFVDGPAGYLSPQTCVWLLEAAEVERELAARAASRARGMLRPNDYRQWLIGEQIPALHEKVFAGRKFANTPGGGSMSFVRLVLAALGENDVTDETIVVQVKNARRRVRTSETPA